MRTFRVIGALVVVSVCCLSLGCGGSDENQVIKPTENYQPTEQEQKNAEQAAKSDEFTGN